MGRRTLEFRRPAGTLVRAIAQSGTTTLFFGFRNRENLLKTLISLPKRRRFILALGQERLERAVQRDRLVDVGARAGPAGAEPDDFLHVRIGRHHAPLARKDRQVGRIGGPRHGAGERGQVLIAGWRPRSAIWRSRTMWPARIARTASATGSLWSSPSTSTLKMPVMVPAPVPGPARSRSRGSSVNTVGV